MSRGPISRSTQALLPNLKDRDVLVIDDIFDTGHTLVEVLAQLLHARAGVAALGRADAQDRTAPKCRSSRIT